MNFEQETYSIPSIDEVSVWYVRTESGRLFDEFVSNEYIALGWNKLTKNRLERSLSEESLKNEIGEFYDSQRPGKIINQSNDFIYSMKSGDIVIFPDKGSNRYCYAMLQNYYEEKIDNSTVIERNFFDQYEDNIEKYGILNPYVKRWKVAILKITESEYLPANIKLILRNNNASMSLNSYKDVCLGQLLPYFIFNNKIYLNFSSRAYNVSVDAISDFISNVSKFITTNTPISSESITCRINVNSPGQLQIITDALDLVKKTVPYDSVAKFLGIFILLSFLVQGGKLFGIELPGLLQLLAKWNERKLNKARISAEIEEQNANQQKYVTEQLEQEIRQSELQSMLNALKIEENNVQKSDKERRAIEFLTAAGYSVTPVDTPNLADKIKRDSIALQINALDEQKV